MTQPQRIYWRRIGVAFHAFRLSRDGDALAPYRSLCRQFSLTRIGGQECSRPPAVRRCTRCDLAEMRLRGWDESGPAEVEHGS